MAQGSFQHCLEGFTLLQANDGQPFHVDSGGATSFGVTRSTWSRWLKRPATDDDMKALSPEIVAPLYQAWYWDTVCGDDLPRGIDLMVFDHGVLSGECSSVMHIQQVVRVDVDGWMGPETLAAIKKHNQHALLGMLSWRHETYYRSLVTFHQNPGWISRLDRRVEAALEMMK